VDFNLNKKELSERDICTKFITPAVKDAGWNIITQIREEVTFTKGRIIVQGQTAKRGKTKRADYILYYKPNIPIALIEAKDNTYSVGSGMQQALEYGEMQDIPFVFSSNGDAFLFHDRSATFETLEQELALSAFPSPETLWQHYRRWKGLEDEEVEQVALQDYYDDGSGRAPRYYQLVAINRTVEAIAKGQDRILLVMATGTGKTYTAFQIIWRLWKAKAKKRILFLADRNILVDQAKTNDFKPFGTAMTKISNRTVDKSYEIYLSLYQAVTGTEIEQNIFTQFSPEFFDLIVIDECHRGSAAEDSSWRRILEYFSGATQIGLTATPKETTEVSNIDYFGDPLYTYSLKEGISDGFLAPYKVVRVDIDKDLTGWRPTAGMRDKYGAEIEDRIYNQVDYDRHLIIEPRTSLVAKKVSDYLKETDRMGKTIIFCEDIDHAERMRQALVNENADLVAKNYKYVMRITGDNEQGKAELDNFILPWEPYPVVVTTSKLMTTGVDAQTCKLIVLDRRIGSMTEFKQIIGRGTRVAEDYGKLFFTIMDFKKATELFADPDFDGPPIQVYEPTPDESPVPPPELDEGALQDETVSDTDITISEEEGEGRRKYYVANMPISVMAERVQYYGANGKLITESLTDYTKSTVTRECSTLESFLQLWSGTEKKQAIIEALEEQGVLFEELEKKVGKDYDPFDLICHIVYDQPPLTRRERAERVRKRDYFTEYSEEVRRVLDALLEKYEEAGIESIEDLTVLKLNPLSTLGSPKEIVGAFGGKQQYLEALQGLENRLYAA
jgi:type I restriction enzyme R subunit